MTSERDAATKSGKGGKREQATKSVGESGVEADDQRFGSVEQGQETRRLLCSSSGICVGAHQAVAGLVRGVFICTVATSDDTLMCLQNVFTSRINL